MCAPGNELKLALNHVERLRTPQTCFHCAVRPVTHRICSILVLRHFCAFALGLRCATNGSIREFTSNTPGAKSVWRIAWKARQLPPIADSTLPVYETRTEEPRERTTWFHSVCQMRGFRSGLYQTTTPEDILSGPAVAKPNDTQLRKARTRTAPPSQQPETEFGVLAPDLASGTWSDVGPEIAIFNECSLSPSHFGRTVRGRTAGVISNARAAASRRSSLGSERSLA